MSAAARPRPGATVQVLLPQPLHAVVLLRRLNRFAVQALLPGHAGRVVRLHLPNSGRMTELLQPGTPGRAWLWGQGGAGAGGAAADAGAAAQSYNGGAARPDNGGGARADAGASAEPRARTAGRLVLVHSAGTWVGVDAHLPNRLFAAALKAGALPAFAGCRWWRHEVRAFGVRVDFALSGGTGPTAADAAPWLVETKSCNRVDDGVALFPDAPSARAVRHVGALTRVVLAGGRAALVWCVQRADAVRLRPFREVDPAFAEALAAAARAGVALHAYACALDERAARLEREIPVEV